MERHAEESDQLPEEAPEEQVPDDAGDDARDEAQRNPGSADDDDSGQATGHPDNAG